MSTDKLPYGSPVPDQECWSRALTNTDHVTRDGTVHTSALKGNGGLGPSTQPGWSHELSGRLTSLAPNLIADAQARVEIVKENLKSAGKTIPTKIKFMGIAFLRANETRAIPNIVADVLYTPDDADIAHADIVIQHPAGLELNSSRAKIAGRLRFVAAANLDAVVETCGQPSSVPPTPSQPLV